MPANVFQELLNSLTRRSTRAQNTSARGKQGVSSDQPPTPEKLQADCERLLASDGELTAMDLARSIFDTYDSLPDAESRFDFFARLRRQFDPDPDEIGRAYEAYRQDSSGDAVQLLFDACEPPRQELLRRLNLVPDGTRELVRMREDLLALLRDNPELRPVDHDFGHLFGSWFNRGFLVVRKIDWDSPASVLENLIKHEAVHEIRDWDDLQRRLDSRDRRCFAFFHPALGNEPLIFVEVALTDKLPATSQDVTYAEEGVYPPGTATIAAFYGISNCQPGLRGVSFGNSLLKQVVRELKNELPNLDTFITMSPVPGLARWLRQLRSQEIDGPEVSEGQRDTLSLLDAPDWHTTLSQEKLDRLREVMLPLAAWYLVEAKNDRGLPLNPVARFHLRNGARMEHINWLGDRSEKNLRNGAGMMVNYVYDIDQIEVNHEHLMNEGLVMVSPEVKKLIPSPKKRKKEAPA